MFLDVDNINCFLFLSKFAEYEIPLSRLFTPPTTMLLYIIGTRSIVSFAMYESRPYETNFPSIPVTDPSITCILLAESNLQLEMRMFLRLVLRYISSPLSLDVELMN